MALYNAYRYNYSDVSGCSLIIDIGARTTNLIFIEPNKVFSRSILNQGGNTVTQAIAKDFNEPFSAAEERKKREIDPTLSILRACAMEATTDGQTAPETRQRIEGLLEFLETMSSWYEQVKSLPKPVLVTLMKMGGRVARFVPRARGTAGKKRREDEA